MYAHTRKIPALAGGLAALALAVALPAAADAAAARPSPVKASQLRADMRKLWEDHIVWTRLYIVAAAAGLPDKDLTAQRLLQNQVDIGNAIKPFYGDAAGDKLTALLKDHILIAADVVDAAKAGDATRTNAALAKWKGNGEEVATFLSAANPKHWPAAEMKHQMQMHLDLTLKEAQDRLAGRWAEDIKDYDRVHEHILGMADVLAGGIAAQFPGRFTRG